MRLDLTLLFVRWDTAVLTDFKFGPRIPSQDLGNIGHFHLKGLVKFYGSLVNHGLISPSGL